MSERPKGPIKVRTVDGCSLPIVPTLKRRNVGKEVVCRSWVDADNPLGGVAELSDVDENAGTASCTVDCTHHTQV